MCGAASTVIEKKNRLFLMRAGTAVLQLHARHRATKSANRALVSNVCIYTASTIYGPRKHYSKLYCCSLSWVGRVPYSILVFRQCCHKMMPVLLLCYCCSLCVLDCRSPPRMQHIRRTSTPKAQAWIFEYLRSGVDVKILKRRVLSIISYLYNLLLLRRCTAMYSSSI